MSTPVATAVRRSFTLLSAIALSACQEKDAAAPAGPPEVLVSAVVQQDVPIVREWLGTLDGSSNADIRARVSGYLQEQKYSEGTVVKKGDVLFLIDARPLEAALAQAKAQVTQAEAQQGRTEAELQKQKELFEKKVTSQRDYDNALQSNLANVGIGDLVGPSTGALTAVSTVDPIKAKFPISEQEYLKFSKELTTAMATPLADRPARSELVLADGQVFPEKGTFFSIDRQVSVKTGTIALEVIFPNPGNLLRPGQYAKVRAVLKTQPNALLVPQRAVMEMQGSYSVAIVGADSRAEIRPVKVGERVGSLWVISEGLKPGEKVVVEGVQKVRTGAPVKARPWTVPAKPAPVSAKPASEAPPEAK